MADPTIKKIKQVKRAPLDMHANKFYIYKYKFVLRVEFLKSEKLSSIQLMHVIKRKLCTQFLDSSFDFRLHKISKLHDFLDIA